MKILIGCEFSGIVRDSFAELGHDVMSCDFLPSEKLGKHEQTDVRNLLYNYKWDLGIFFPPCKYLCVSGARWFKYRKKEQLEALSFVTELMHCPIYRIAIENPIGVISTHIRKPDQIIHPWMFGHGETKATCLWLKNLPKLKPTKIMKERKHSIHYMSPSPDRSKNRSRTFEGIAKAMAEQWSIFN